MEPRVLRVERVFPNSFLQGRDYSWFQIVFSSLVEEMKLRICGCFMNKQATFVLNREMYRLFYSVAPMVKGPYWDGIYIKEDLTPDRVPWNKDAKPKGRILLEYREPVYIPFELTERSLLMPPYETKCLEKIFDTAVPFDRLKFMIKNWLEDRIKDAHFDAYDYTITVGEKLLAVVNYILSNPDLRISSVLDKTKVECSYNNVDPLRDTLIKITWREPAHKLDDLKYALNIQSPSGVMIRKCFTDDVSLIIKKVIYNNPATIIFWRDGTKTVVQCQPEDEYDPEKGLALAIAKKALGNTSRNLNDVLHKWEKKEEPSVPHSCANCKYGDQKLSKEPCKSCDASFGNWEAEE